VDPSAGELYKQGRKVKLQDQPFQALVALLEHPRQIITREELQKRLWPDTVVDFDRGINKAINRLREVLGMMPTIRGSLKQCPTGDIVSLRRWKPSRRRLYRCPHLNPGVLPA